MTTLTSTRPSPAAPAQATARSATWWPGALPPPSLVAPHSVAAAGGWAGRAEKSSYSAYYQGDMPGVSNLEHVYAGASHVQNYDGASAYGAVWHWAGSSSGAGGSARHFHGSPLNSPNPDTASQKGYNIAALGGKNTPQRRSWLSPSSEGNKREIYGQGRPQAKDSSGNGANWYLGTVSNPAGGGSNVESRFFFEGTVSATDMSRATDAREASRIGIFGTSNSYGGSYGRVTNEALGRDLNPLGRGNGQALVGGMLNVGSIAPSMPKAVLGGGAQGSSVNNPCSSCSGGAQDRAYYGKWVDPNDPFGPCQPHPAGAEWTNPSACCGFDCECGCTYSGASSCCHHSKPTGQEVCAISAAPSAINTDRNAFAEARDRGYFLIQQGMSGRGSDSVKQKIQRSLNRSIIHRRSIMGVPMPLEITAGDDNSVGAPPQFRRSKEFLTPEMADASFNFMCKVMASCVPDDLRDCLTQACNGNFEFVYECEEGVNPAPGITTCRSGGATIHLCVDAIRELAKAMHELNPGLSEDDAFMLILQNVIVHELFHVMLCCATGKPNGCYGIAGELVVDACTEKCMKSRFIESDYTTLRKTKGCTCEKGTRGNCMSENLFDCDGGVNGPRCSSTA